MVGGPNPEVMYVVVVHTAFSPPTPTGAPSLARRPTVSIHSSHKLRMVTFSFLF